MIAQFVLVVFSLFVFVAGCGGGVSGVGPRSNDLGIAVPLGHTQVPVKLPAAGEVRQSAKLQKVKRNLQMPEVNYYKVYLMANGALVSSETGYPGDTVILFAPIGDSQIVITGFGQNSTVVARGEYPLTIAAGQTTVPEVSVEVHWTGQPVAITIVPPPAPILGSEIFTASGSVSDGQTALVAPTIEFTAGQRYRVFLDSTPDSVDFDIIVQPAGLGTIDWERVIASRTTSSGDEQLEFTPSTTGRFDFFVDSYSGTGTFTLRVTQ